MHDLIYNGISLSSFGFCIADKPKYSIAKRNFETTEVVGRNGVILSDKGAYSAVELSYKINSIPYKVPCTDSNNLVRQLAEWLTVWDGDFKILRDTYNEGCFSKAICTGIETLTEITNKCLSTTIKFVRQPFLYSDEGQVKSIHTTSDDLGVYFSIYNPENYNSLPYIKVYGNGGVCVDINGKTFNILKGFREYIEIDSESQNAFKGTSNYNSYVDCDYMPELLPGKNTIKIYGILDSASQVTGKCTAVEIVPRWRRL